MTLTIQADNAYYVYHEGDVVLSHAYWDGIHSVSLSDVCVLTVKGEKWDGDHGVIASTSTGVVTDASWKCSGGVEQTGWHLAGFDDASWSQARVVAPNDGSVWFTAVSGFNPAAQWIWSQDSSDDVIYCRKLLCWLH